MVEKVKEVLKRPPFPVKVTRGADGKMSKTYSDFTPDERKKMKEYGKQRRAYLRYKYGGKTINRLIDMNAKLKGQIAELKKKVKETGSAKQQIKEEQRIVKLKAQKEKIEAQLAAKN